MTSFIMKALGLEPATMGLKVETIHDVHLPLGESEAKFGPSVCLAKLLSLKIVPYDERGDGGCTILLVGVAGIDHGNNTSELSHGTEY